jgi:hypothetical protein
VKLVRRQLQQQKLLLLLLVLLLLLLLLEAVGLTSLRLPLPAQAGLQ